MHRFRRAAFIGLTALFAAAAADTTALATAQAATDSYNPHPATRAEAAGQIGYLLNADETLNDAMARFLDTLQTNAPFTPRDAAPAAGTCVTISTGDANFGFNYGPGQINTPMGTLMNVPARRENGALVPVLPPGTRYFTGADAFLRASADAIGGMAYADPALPPSYIGCAPAAALLRVDQQKANLALGHAFLRRMEARMQQDYRTFTALRGTLPPAP